MKIGIIGAGGPETLSQVARATGAVPVAISDVAKGVDLLVIAIPMANVPASLDPTFHSIRTGRRGPVRTYRQRKRHMENESC